MTYLLFTENLTGAMFNACTENYNVLLQNSFEYTRGGGGTIYFLNLKCKSHLSLLRCSAFAKCKANVCS